jgi:hypothetical protein
VAIVAAREVVTMGDRPPGGKPDPRDGLTFEQRQVMRLLAKEMPMAEAARKAGLNEERVKRWTKTPAFQDALARERSDPSRSSLRDVGGLLRAASKPKPEIPRSPIARRSMALDLLVSGSSVTEAAELSGYTRQHLSQLINHDDDFRAEYERRLVEDQMRRANLFWTTWSSSLGVIKQSLAEGDPRTAMDVFRLGARGVTDVERRDPDVERTQSVGEQRLPLPPAPTPVPDAGMPAIESAGLTCNECGLEAKSQRGLTQHRNAKHGNSEKRQDDW